MKRDVLCRMKEDARWNISAFSADFLNKETTAYMKCIFIKPTSTKVALGSKSGDITKKSLCKSLEVLVTSNHTSTHPLWECFNTDPYLSCWGHLPAFVSCSTITYWVSIVGDIRKRFSILIVCPESLWWKSVHKKLYLIRMKWRELFGFVQSGRYENEICSMKGETIMEKGWRVQSNG